MIRCFDGCQYQTQSYIHTVNVADANFYICFGLHALRFGWFKRKKEVVTYEH